MAQRTSTQTARPVIVEEGDTPTTIIAADIRKVSLGFERLLSTGLTHKAIAVLIKDATGVPMATTMTVLDALPTLAARYTTPKAAKKKARR